MVCCYFLSLTLFVVVFSSSSSDSKSSSNSDKKNKGSKSVGEIKAVYLGNGNSYDFGVDTVSFCDGYRHLWEDPSIPNEKRNNIGRGKFQTPKKVNQAKKLIKLGKAYEISYDYSNDVPLLFALYPAGVETELICDEFEPGKAGGCTNSLNSGAFDNTGTQFDGIGHIYLVNSDGSDRIFHNNFKFSEIVTQSGLKYIGMENYPSFFTRAFLLDVPKYLGLDKLPLDYDITTNDIIGTLNNQNMNVNDLNKGDCVLVYTGWAEQHWFDGNNGDYLNFPIVPGLLFETFLDIFYKRGVMIVGSDTSGVTILTDFDPHTFWMSCAGGFLHESVKLDEWIKDARNGKVPYKGAYVFEPFPLVGASCTPGKVMVYV